MPKLWRAMAAVGLCLLGAAAPVHGQDEADFTTMDDWTPVDGAALTATPEGLSLTAGTIRSSRSYRDVVFRFDYRLRSARASAAVVLRSHVGSDGAVREYAVALDALGSSGQLSATGMPLVETHFAPRADAASDWTPCEVRIARGRLTVTIGGAIISAADRVEGPESPLAFRVRTDGIDLRRLRVAKPSDGSTPPVSFHPELPRGNEPGLTPPSVVKQTRPSYPMELRSRRITGEVRLAAEITVDGQVGDLHILASPHPDLIPLAVACAREWRFKPATRNGVATGMVVTLEVAFNLRR